MSDILRIQSAHGTASIEFRILLSDEEQKAFAVAATFGAFQGSITSTTYFVGSPADLFVDCAEHWNGWIGDKIWAAIDGELELSMSTSSLGQVRLMVSIKSDDVRLDGCIYLEAGQLESIARKSTEFFGDVPNFGRTIA